MSKSAAIPPGHVALHVDIDYAMTMALKLVWFTAEGRQWTVLAIDHAGNVRAQEWLPVYEQAVREERWFTGEEAFAEKIRERIEEAW